MSGVERLIDQAPVSSVLSGSSALVGLLGQKYQLWQDIAQRRILRPPKREIQLLIEWIERVVYSLGRWFRRKYRVIRANLILSLFHRLERPRGEKSEDRRTQTDDTLARNENRPLQHIRVDLIQRVVFLRNATCIDHA